MTELYGPYDQEGREKIEHMVRDDQDSESAKESDIQFIADALSSKTTYIGMIEALDNEMGSGREGRVAEASFEYYLQNRDDAALGAFIYGAIRRYHRKVAELQVERQ